MGGRYPNNLVDVIRGVVKILRSRGGLVSFPASPARGEHITMAAFGQCCRFMRESLVANCYKQYSVERSLFRGLVSVVPHSLSRMLRRQISVVPHPLSRLLRC